MARKAEVRPSPTCIQLVTGLPQEMPVGHLSIVDNRAPSPPTQMVELLIQLLSACSIALEQWVTKHNRSCSVATLN